MTQERGLFVKENHKLVETYIYVPASHVEAWKSVDSDYMHIVSITNDAEHVYKITFQYNPEYVSSLMIKVFTAAMIYGLEYSQTKNIIQ